MLWNCRLPADIRLVVYAEGARTEEGWDFLMEMYRHTIYPSEKSQIKAALSYSPLAHKLEWLVQMWFIECKLNNQNTHWKTLHLTIIGDPSQ